MKLTIGERLSILNILPSESNFITLKVIRKLKEDVGFTDEEIKYHDFKQDGGKVTWEKGDEEKEFNIEGTATSIISEALKDLDKQKKLTEQYISLYEKFI